MPRIPTLLTLALLCASAPCQSSLADLRARFDRDREELVRERQGRVSFQDFKAMAERHAGLLESWLGDASGADAINGRLLLVNIQADIGREDAARDTLRALDAAAAPALELAAAAELAGRLGMGTERESWIDAAVGKDAPFEERMALALFLMTRLVEVDRGEAIFDAALAAAEDDEARAHVLWYRATAVREREDLEEGAYEKALDELAGKFPKTYWGGVARDRRAAFELEVGSEAIPFSGTTLGGDVVTLAAYRGKVLLLDFWEPTALRGRSTHRELTKLVAEYGERGFAVLGVAMDEDADAVKAAAKAEEKTWPHVFDGRGLRADIALRYGVEQVPDYVLVGRDGKIAAIRIFLQDEYGVRELRDAIERALRADG
ncbi:MAG: TlpA disulfide reductase family protein [Planctomycetota bacterium]|nr:TlpA disulfide reductase family protein [Planctomycetota bacterium]